MSTSKHLLLGPELIQGDGGSEGKGPLCMEYTVHAVPNTYRDEVKAVFPNADLDALKAVITCQKSQVDLVKQGEQVENEKNELLERVSPVVLSHPFAFAFASQLTARRGVEFTRPFVVLTSSFFLLQNETCSNVFSPPHSVFVLVS